MRKLHVFIVPFDVKKGELLPVHPQPATSKEAGIRRAGLMAEHFAGIGVYGVWVDDVTCDASDLHEIERFGDVPDISDIPALAA